MRKLILASIVFGTLLLAVVFRPKPSPASANQPRSITTCQSNFSGPYGCSNVDWLSLVDVVTLDADLEANDVWGWTDSRDGREYALIGVDNGTGFVDITNPVEPTYLGKLPTHSVSSIWRDIKVVDDHAYIGSEAAGHGVQVFNLRQLRDIVSSSAPVVFTHTAHYDGVGASHNVIANDDSGFVYTVGTVGIKAGTEPTCDGGLHAIDVSTPTNPSFAGCFGADGYSHDAQCVMYNGPDTDYVGQEICFASNEDTVTVVDFTDKSNPIIIARPSYVGVEYVHQGWLTEDHRYFVSNDELDERENGHQTRSYVWDMTDLDNIPAPSVYEGPFNNIDHNIYIKGDRVYQANYRAGLRILDSSDISNGNLTEIAHFDTYTRNNGTAFNGAWSSYPYFDSDTILVSDIEQGLFLLRTALSAEFAIAPSPSRLDRCGDAPATVSLQSSQIAGFVGSLDLTTDGMGVYTMTPDSATISAGSSQSLQITSTDVASGTYHIAISGSSPTNTLTTTLLVHQLAAPIGTSPARAATNVPLAPTFSWNGSSNVQLEVSTDALFANVVVDETVSGSSFTVSSDLAAGQTYFWRLSAETGACASQVAWSGSFTTTTSPLSVDLATAQSNNGPARIVLPVLAAALLTLTATATGRIFLQHSHRP